MVDQIIVLDEGRIEKQGNKDKILPDLMLQVDDCRAGCNYFKIS